MKTTSPANSLGIAVIGAGNIARFHARAIQDLEGAHLAGLYSDIPEMTRKLAGAFGVPAFHELDAVLDHPGIGAVTIATPSGTHADLGIAAARAGKHVMCEKPLDITLERIDRLIAACAESRVQLGAVFQSRFGPGARAVHRIVRAGWLGRRTVCNAQIKWWRTQQYYDSGGWRGTWELDGGGALMNQGIHAIDLLVWMCGLPAAVAAFAETLAHERIQVEDAAVAALRWEDGAVGWIEGTTAAYPGYAKRLELSGDRGSVVLEDDRIVTLDVAERAAEAQELRAQLGAASTVGGGASDPLAIDYTGHKLQFQDFVDAIREARPPAVHGREARQAVALILAIYRAARGGARIDPRSL